MTKNTMIFIGVLIIVIIIQLAIIIFKSPEVIHDNSKEEALRDSIAILQDKIEISHQKQKKLQLEYDILSGEETKVITRTRDKIKYIYTDANPNELDSIIRANWKRDPGHN